MYAVIKTGGKQYRVAEGDKLVVEKVAGEAGDTVTFDQVLMLSGDDGVTVGSPLVAGASVTAELVDVRKGDKVLVFKKRRRQNYRRTKGHRQWEALIAISEIVLPGAKPKAKPAAKKADKADTASEKAAPAAKPAAKKADAPKAEAPKAETKKAEAKPAAKKSAAKSDDLTAITGIGPAYAKKLNEAGVTTYAQIAGWKAADLDALDEQVPGVKAKAESDDWVKAAKDLAKS